MDCEKIDENVGLPFGATKCSDAHTFFADPLHYYRQSTNENTPVAVSTRMGKAVFTLYAFDVEHGPFLDPQSVG